MTRPATSPPTALRRAFRALTGAALYLVCVVFATSLAATPAAAAAGPAADPGAPLVPWDRAVGWSEEQRAFVQDGPALLLSEETRRELAGADEEGRQRIIDTFLGRDPVPATPADELEQGIERRRSLVRSELETFNDDRARLLFLHGRPLQRVEVTCGTVYRPMEIWSYLVPGETPARDSGLDSGLDYEDGGPDDEVEADATTPPPPPVAPAAGEAALPPTDPTGSDAAPFLVLYQPADDEPFKLWVPLDAKRSLYTSQFEYILEQWEGIPGRYRGRRPDRIMCDRTRLVERATGVRTLTNYRRDRPRKENYLAWLRPPADLAGWATVAAQTPLDIEAGELAVEEVEIYFPRATAQRMISQLHVTLPPDAGYGVAEAEASGNPQLRLLVEGVIEQGGKFFDDFRVRFRPPPPEPGAPLTLIFDRELRPGLVYLVRMAVRDEVTGARSHRVMALRVPGEAAPGEVPQPAPGTAAATGRDLGERREIGEDALTLLPPAAETVLKLWRASVLVAGDRIENVVFYVDGERQLATARRPFSAELRLSDLPTEQVVRAEGYDAAGNLVALDEVVVNRARAGFDVRIVTPGEGAQVSGTVPVEVDVSVPDEKRLERVEVKLNDELVATLEEPPYVTEIEVTDGSEVSYLAVTGFLADGTRTETVRFLNAEEGFAEQVEVQLVEVYVAAQNTEGRLVQGLERGDFRVFEEGVEQEIERFEVMDSLPLTLGLAIDTSGSMADSLGEAKAAAAEFLSRVVGPGDRSFALSFASFPNLLMPPTGDTEVVSRAVEELRARGATVLHDAVVTALSYFRELEGQQALVVLSDGDDTASTFDFGEALDYARRSEASVYTIGLEIPATAIQIRNKLRRLAAETGGRVFFINRAEELEDVYQQIEDELRSRYLLVYSPRPAPEPGSGFRRVEVESTEPGVRTRTVRGYYP